MLSTDAKSTRNCPPKKSLLVMSLYQTDFIRCLQYVLKLIQTLYVFSGKLHVLYRICVKWLSICHFWQMHETESILITNQITVQAGCAHLPNSVWSGTTVSLQLHPAHRRFQPPPSSVVVILAAIVIRRTRLSTVGDRAFPVAGSRLWNSLPPDVTGAPILAAFFLNHVKTYFFTFVRYGWICNFFI